MLAEGISASGTPRRRSLSLSRSQSPQAMVRREATTARLGLYAEEAARCSSHGRRDIDDYVQ